LTADQTSYAKTGNYRKGKKNYLSPRNFQKQDKIMTSFLATTPFFCSIMKYRLENKGET